MKAHEDQEMAVNEFTYEQLLDIAKHANAATGADAFLSDDTFVKRLLMWASEDRVSDMTPWQRAAWERIQQIRAEHGQPQPTVGDILYERVLRGEPIPPGPEATGACRKELEQRIREIRERTAKASPGPWRRGSVALYHVFCHYPEGLAGPVLGERVILRMNEHSPYVDDASFIANARQDLPDLCNAADTLLARVDELEKAATEALDGWKYNCSYKGVFLTQKHGDHEDIARLRAIVGRGDGT
jgi:hypothetical protein